MKYLISVAYYNIAYISWQQWNTLLASFCKSLHLFVMKKVKKVIFQQFSDNEMLYIYQTEKMSSDDILVAAFFYPCNPM